MKFFFIFSFAIILIISSIGFWSIASKGYDRQNKVILAIKKVVPTHLLRKIKDTIFIVPNLKEKNRVLNLQVKKYEQGLNGQLFKEEIILSQKGKKFKIKEYFLPFKRLDLRLGWAATENSRRAHYLEIIKDKVLLISGLGKTIYFDKKNINLDKLNQKEIPNNLKELLVNKNKIKSLGGLYVIGTERMESRRVDNQARGRAGRQGDEGSSIFYVSLEDDLMRIFGSESMNNILQKLGLKDGESIDHPWINKALERAQQKVEARNFDIRKNLLKFDDVLNDQRHVIFSQRNNVMNSEKVFDYSDEFLSEIIDHLISLKTQKLSKIKNNEFNNQLKILLGKSVDDNEFESLTNLKDQDFKEKINSKFLESRNERIKILDEEKAKEIEKRIFLQCIDLNWKSHIQYLEQLRQVVGLRSYGQRDPLVEYKKEAFDLFENLLNKLKLDYITILMNLRVVQREKEEEEIKIPKIDPKYNGKKMSRNEPCFCGSKKKFKHCCGGL